MRSHCNRWVSAQHSFHSFRMVGGADRLESGCQDRHLFIFTPNQKSNALSMCLIDPCNFQSNHFQFKTMGLLLAAWEFLFVLKSPSPADASRCRWVQQHRMKTTENPTVMCREKSRPFRFCTLAGLRVERSRILLSEDPTDPTAPIIYWACRWYDVDSNLSARQPGGAWHMARQCHCRVAPEKSVRHWRNPDSSFTAVHIHNLPVSTFFL